jgi:hypothetical protein
MRHLLFALPFVLAASTAMACNSAELMSETKAVAAKTQALIASKNPQAMAAWQQYMAANPVKAGISMDELCTHFYKLNNELDTLMK